MENYKDYLCNDAFNRLEECLESAETEGMKTVVEWMIEWLEEML
ncbi:hypothetical protein [Halomonas gemina]|nr:hypothetical protein [Halomonas gemina]